MSALSVQTLARGNGGPADVSMLLAVREQTYLLGSLVALGLGAGLAASFAVTMASVCFDPY